MMRQKEENTEYIALINADLYAEFWKFANGSFVFRKSSCIFIAQR